MSDYKIVVDQLTNTPRSEAFEVPEAWWIQREEEVLRSPTPVEKPFSFEIQASRVADELIFVGDFRGWVSLECSRCGKRYSHALRDEFRLVLSPLPAHGEAAQGKAGLGDAADPEGAERLARTGLCLGEDLDSGWYRGPVLQLDDVFGEVIALAMPLQPLCSEDCPGVCAHCGAAREKQADTKQGDSDWVATCDCVDEKVDSPFAVLAQLKREET